MCQKKFNHNNDELLSIEINISKIVKQLVYLQSIGFNVGLEWSKQSLELLLLCAIAVDKLFSIISN